MRVDLPLDKKKLENQGWATGPPGRRGLSAAGPSGAVGRWAAGLLLAKPSKKSCLFNNKPPLQFRNKTVYNQLVLHNVRIPYNSLKTCISITPG